MTLSTFSVQLGAFVNEQYQAREGLEADAFGERVTYLGHYHKPQLVSDTSVRYVGSPYQGICIGKAEIHPSSALIELEAVLWDLQESCGLPVVLPS